MKYFTSCCVVLSLVALQTSAAVIDAVTLNGKTYTCPNEDTTITALTVTGGSSGNVVGVPAGVTLTVTGYTGGGALEKTGAGKLVICDVDPAANLTATEGELFFAKSTGVESLAGAAHLHLDASKTDSFTFVNDDGVNVTKWRDVRDAAGGTTYPNARYSWGAYPSRVAGKQNGLGTVDFYATTDGWNPCMLMMSNDDGASDSFAYGKGPGVTGVREVFMVVRDEPNLNLSGRKYQSFLCDYDAPGNYNYWFCRGNNGEIWSDAYNETAGLRGGNTWVDGAAVSGTSVFPSGGFHLLRARRSNSGRFSTLCYDHQGTDAGLGGGLAIGELIVFRADGQPGDDVAAAMTSRLMHKWFGRQTIASLSVANGAKVSAASGETVRVVRADGGTVEVTDAGVVLVIAGGETCVVSANARFLRIRADGAGATLQVAADAVVTAETCGGAGALVKTGAGRLEITEIDADANVTAEEGTVAFVRSLGVESLAGAAHLHLDASKADSFAFVNDDGINVTKWRDVRDGAGGTTYPNAYYSWGAYPSRVTGKQNGLGTVDFYATTDGWNPCMLMMSNDDGAGDFAYGKGPGMTGVREVFMVVKDEPNLNLSGRKYQSFLCDFDAPGNYNYWFCRGNNGEIWSDVYNETAGLRGGNTWVDGAAVSGTSVFPSGGFHLLRARRSNNGRFSTLCYDHQGTEAGLGGGLAIGELIVFRADGQPDDALASEISSRLMHKWFGKQAVGSLSISPNGAVEVASGELLQPTSLTLAGLTAVAGAMPILPTDLTITESGTVALTFPAGQKVKANVAIPLVTATGTVTGADNLANWSVVCDWPYGVKLAVVDKTLCAIPNPPGMTVIVR